MSDPSNELGSALVFTGPATGWRMVSQPMPEPGPGAVVVRVEAATVCASDLHTLHGRRGAPCPSVLGHETVGRIVAWGTGPSPRDTAGTPLHVGDRVAWAVVAACGTCPPCRGGLPQKCLAGIKYGHEPLEGVRAWTGGFATWVLLAPGTAIVRLPEALPASLAAPASCATATAMHAWRSLGTPAGRRVVVTGAGLLGLTAAAIARQRGAAEVVVIDPDTRRHDAARAVGATASPAPPDDGQARFDLWFEASGQPAIWPSMLPRLALAARVAVVGAVFPAPAAPVDLETVVRRCLSITGIHNYAPADLAEAVAWLATLAPDHPLGDAVGAWFALDDHARAAQVASTSGALRVGFRPGPTTPPRG